MRNQGNTCNCGNIGCDSAQDYNHLSWGVRDAMALIVTFIDEICDPRRDAPRLERFVSSTKVTETGFDRPKYTKFTFIGVSQESAEAVIARIEQANQEFRDGFIDTDMEWANGTMTITLGGKPNITKNKEKEGTE